MPFQRQPGAVVAVVLATIQVAEDRNLHTGLDGEVTFCPKDAGRQEYFRPAGVGQVRPPEFSMVSVLTIQFQLQSLFQTCDNLEHPPGSTTDSKIFSKGESRAWSQLQVKEFQEIFPG